jgi:hypothetical protein
MCMRLCAQSNFDLQPGHLGEKLTCVAAHTHGIVHHNQGESRGASKDGASEALSHC